MISLLDLRRSNDGRFLDIVYAGNVILISLQGPLQKYVYKSQWASVNSISEEVRKKGVLSGNTPEIPLQGSMPRLASKFSSPGAASLSQCNTLISPVHD